MNLINVQSELYEVTSRFVAQINFRCESIFWNNLHCKLIKIHSFNFGSLEKKILSNILVGYKYVLPSNNMMVVLSIPAWWSMA